MEYLYEQICMFWMPFITYIESLKDIYQRRLGAEQVLLMCPAVWPNFQLHDIIFYCKLNFNYLVCLCHWCTVLLWIKL